MLTIVTERKIDKKRRVTLPPNVNLIGTRIIMIASQNTAIITSNKHIAEKLAKTLHKLETNHKTQTLTEWEKMTDEAGLTSLTSRSINHTVRKSTQSTSPHNLDEIIEEADKMTDEQFEKIAAEIFKGSKTAAKLVAEGRDRQANRR